MAAIIEAVILASSCSIDAFTASFAYGSKGIRIPFLSNQIVNLICSSVLGLSLWAGAAVRQFLPGWITVAAAFTILFILGVVKLLDSVTKTVIRRHYESNDSELRKEYRFRLFNFNFMLNLYANPENADADGNKVISPGEAAALAVSLSLDGLAIGFGAGIGSINILAVVAASLVTDMLAVFLGCALGYKLSRKLPFNLSWISGIVLIGLAVTKLL